MLSSRGTLELQLWLDENHFATPLMRTVSFSSYFFRFFFSFFSFFSSYLPLNQAYTVLGSSRWALFLHMTMSIPGATLTGKSYFNGTLSEVSNPEEWRLPDHKVLQSKLGLSYT